MLELSGKSVYRFADVEVDAPRGRITRNGEELHLRQQTFQVLLYLLERRERLVTKDELFEHIWKETAVTDNALLQCIFDIRRSLGDDSRRPRFVKTYPKVGYRFIGEVKEVSSGVAGDVLEVEDITVLQVEVESEIESETLESFGSERERASEGLSLKKVSAPSRRFAFSHRALFIFAAALILLAGVWAFKFSQKTWGENRQLTEITLPKVPGRHPLAVLYFENRSGSQDLDWLREGLADMLITDLSRSEHLIVLSRAQLHLLLERINHPQADALRLDEALELTRRSRAEVFVLGSFARLGEKIRIDVQLHAAEDGRLLAAESLVVDKPSEIFSEIDLLSLKLAAHLGETATAAQDANKNLSSVMTSNLQAYHYYSLAVEKANSLLYVEAVALLEKAVALDPEFAMAYARIGYTYALCWARLDESKPYLEKAFQLSSRLTEKDRLSIAAWYAIANQDYPSAIEAYRQIIARYPLEVEAYWRLARLLRGEDRIEESVNVARQGLAVDSEAKDLYNVLGGTYMEMGRHDEAIETLQHCLKLAPNDPNIYDSLGMAYQWAGRYSDAIQTFEKALALNPQFEIALAHLGNTYTWQGRYRDAVRQYERFIQAATFDGMRARGYNNLAMLHLKRKEFAEAERAAKETMKYDKKNVGPSLFIALERSDLAAAEKLMAISEADRFADRGNRGYERERSYRRGYLALKSGRADEAIEHFKEAVKQRPMVWYIDAFEDCLANTYLELGRYDEAIKEYERILKLNPNYPLAHYHLAQAYEQQSQIEQARAEYEKFLQAWKEADNDLPEILAARKRIAELSTE